ncbi:MAG: glycosyltransferase [Chloroflexota bacterium]
MSKDYKAPIAVIGTPFSHSHKIAKILTQAGYEIEDQSESPKQADPLNTLDYISNSILEEFGGSWMALPKFEPNWEFEPRFDKFAEKANVILKLKQEKDLWGWHSTKTTLTIPFWKTLIPNLRFLVCFNNPVVVTQMMAKTARIPHKTGSQIWKSYLDAAIKDTNGSDRIFICTDSLESSSVDASSILEFCGVSQQLTSKDFVFEAKNEPLSSLNALLTDDNIPHHHKLFYLGLKGSKSQPNIHKSIDVENFYSIIGHFQDESRLIQAEKKSAAEISTLQLRLNSNNKKLAKKLKEIKALSKQVSELKKSSFKLKSINKNLKEKLEEANIKEEELRKNSSTLSHYQSESVKLEGQILSLTNQVNVRERIIREKSAELSQIENANSAQQDQINKIEIQLTETKLEKEDKSAQLEQHKNQILSLKQQVEEASEVIRDLDSQHEAMRSSIANIEGRNVTLDRRNQELLSEISALLVANSKKSEEIATLLSAATEQNNEITKLKTEAISLENKVQEFEVQQEIDVELIQEARLASQHLTNKLESSGSRIEALKAELIQYTKENASLIEQNARVNIEFQEQQIKHQELLESLSKLKSIASSQKHYISSLDDKKSISYEEIEKISKKLEAANLNIQQKDELVAELKHRLYEQTILAEQVRSASLNQQKQWESIYQSTGWRFLNSYWNFADNTFPVGSRRRKMLQSILPIEGGQDTLNTNGSEPILNSNKSGESVNKFNQNGSIKPSPKEENLSSQSSAQIKENSNNPQKKAPANLLNLQSLEAQLNQLSTLKSGEALSVLNWSRIKKINSLISNHSIFSPLSINNELNQLPYLINSIDVVLIDPRKIFTHVDEAMRIARTAVLTVEINSISDLEVKAVWEAEERIELAESVSIIIPVYNQIEFTIHCINKISETVRPSLNYEIIVVDDCSTDETKNEIRRLQKSVKNLRYHKNPENLGFVGSCNNGSEIARNNVLIFLNNDTLPRTGWLDGILETFKHFPDAGAVGGMLVYPDDTIQEAGGIVFVDGSAANFGNGARELADPLYNYVREVDYCSAALLGIRKNFFFEIGQFSKEFAPGYYEDTDLCFKVREAGRKVYYQPKSRITHFEGVSSGNDLNSGMKQYQLINADRFFSKWQHKLHNHHMRPNEWGISAWHKFSVRTLKNHDSK